MILQVKSPITAASNQTINEFLLQHQPKTFNVLEFAGKLKGKFGNDYQKNIRNEWN